MSNETMTVEQAIDRAIWSHTWDRKQSVLDLIAAVRADQRRLDDERWEKAIGETKQKGHFCAGCGGFYLGETSPSDCDCCCKPKWIEGFAITTAAITAAKSADKEQDK